MLKKIDHPKTHKKEIELRIANPYIKGTSETIARPLNRYKIGIAYKPSRRKYWTKPVKDKTNPLEGPGVYKVKCDCGGVYVGQTRSSVNTRIKEHKACLKKSDMEKSAIAKHALQEVHVIQWENTDVLHMEETI
jgi:hypothetical protein